MPIQNVKLQRLSHSLETNTGTPPNILEKIVGIVGTGSGTSVDQLNASLRSNTLSPEQKMNLVKARLTIQETEDLKAFLAQPHVASKLDAASLNFLKALAGLESLGSVDAFLAGTAAVSRAPEPSSVAAVKKMRELISSGRLGDYYNAAIGLGTPELKDEALKLFEALPKINGNTTADDFVALGLWTKKPAGIDAMQKSARFLPGRQVLVETTVHSDVFEDRSFLSYKEDGVRARTYRATLVGENGDDFLVKVDGRDQPLTVPKKQIFELNQPHAFSGDKMSLSKTVDYSSVFMRAKLAEAAIKMDALVGKLDFTKTSTNPGGILGVLGLGGSSTQMSEVQRQCVRIIHDVIDMKYPDSNAYKEPGRYSKEDAGRQAVRGVGMCYDQASVMAGLLHPFSASLGVDVQFISGGVYRNVQRGDTNPFRGGAHGWLHLIYRPSMELRICDRTWRQPDHPADKAYSRWGDRYPGSFYWGMKTVPVHDTDVNMTGRVTIANFERQFGEQGVDGRENHMSRNQ